ncbi:MAG: hypothetical protein E6I03_07635 [Chloroflexi bacterium]|nr:MAG: hypothetical protein E6I03_07635 [Chloroflexota bacterium]
MLAEKIVVRTTATLLAGGAILGLLAFATQTPALGIALAILILASPPLLFTLAVGLKISSRSKKSSDAGSTESAREIGRWVLFLGCLFLVALVVLGSDLSKSVIVAGGFILGFGCGALALLGIYVPAAAGRQAG